MTAEEILALRQSSREHCAPLLTELERLERAPLIERLMREPLVERLYWYQHFSKGKAPKAERERLVEGEADDDVVDARVVLAKIDAAAQHAAKRRYGYGGFETGTAEETPIEEILTEMIEKANDAPSKILFHAYERALFWYR